MTCLYYIPSNRSVDLDIPDFPIISEVEKVVTVIKEKADPGFGFHLFGSAPVVISTIEPGGC